ncbi:MAG: DUF192 domain-containing protein [Paracoccaceae bacterium]
MRLMLGAMILAALAAPAMAADCVADRLAIRGDFGQASFNVEVADTPDERATGLMHRPSMPRFAGMLFVFDRPERAVFWMENTMIPLDMLFIDETGVVRTIHENAIPYDRTPIDGGPGITYVLEINGGLADMLGIEPGAEIQHPFIAQDGAVWPCMVATGS